MLARTGALVGAGVTPAHRRDRLFLLALVAVGLALRIAGAQGGLWLDEAWSAVLAHDAGTPIAILIGINHDNNHHLNSLWLLLVGMDARPPVQRALSIATGTIAIPVAALLARRLGRGPMLATAALFAVSPILVTFGSEARGYAPMVLAWLCAALVVDRSLADEPRPERRVTLAVAVALGALSQLTMIFGVLALGGWAFFVRAARKGIGPALRRTFHLFAPALGALAAVIGTIAVAAWASPTGWQFGSYERFSAIFWLHALVEMFGYTLGFPVVSIALVLIPVALVGFAPRLGATRLSLYRVAILGFPAAMALLRAGNCGHPRYYLLAGLALLLLLGEVIGRALDRPDRWRHVAVAALALLIGAGLVQDVDLAINRRGDPAVAVHAMQARAPQGADMAFDRSTGRGVMEVAAAQAHYPLRFTENSCPAPRFMLADRFKGEVPPPRLARCGSAYTPIESRTAHGLSGTHWTLYERRP